MLITFRCPARAAAAHEYRPQALSLTEKCGRDELIIIIKQTGVTAVSHLDIILPTREQVTAGCII